MNIKHVLYPLKLVVSIITPSYLTAGWMRTYGEGEGRWVRQSSDDGYIVAGGEILKTDENGEVEWKKDYGSYYYCIDETSDGGYVVLSCKEIAHTGDVKIWILRLENNGDTVWTGFFGDDFRWGGIEGGYIEQIPDGGYVAICEAFVRTDSLGTLKYYEDYDTYLGSYSCANSSSDDHYIVTGYDTLIEVDNTGHVVWGTPIFYQMNWINYINQGHTGYVAAGNTWGPGSDTMPNFDLYVAEHTVTGLKLWDAAWGEVNIWEDAYCIQPIPPDSILSFIGGYIVCGTNSLMKIMLHSEFDAYPVWERKHGGNLYHVHGTNDGGYIVTGELNGDLLLVKTDSLGFVGINEMKRTAQKPQWYVSSPIGPAIVLQYENCPQGFSASVFDAGGRRVDELHSPSSDGVITWGRDHKSGIYFIVPEHLQIPVRKVVLIR